MLPLEEEQRIRQGFSAAVNIATAPVGQLIPHCFLYRIFSCQRQHVSVATLLAAGWVPGLCGQPCAWWCTPSTAQARICDETGQDDCGHHLKTIWRLFPAVLVLIVIIIGGILSGYSHHRGFRRGSGVRLPLSVFVYKSIQIKDIPKMLVDTAVMTTIVC